MGNSHHVRAFVENPPSAFPPLSLKVQRFNPGQWRCAVDHVSWRGAPPSCVSQNSYPLILHTSLRRLVLFQYANTMGRSQRYSHYLPLKRRSRTTSRAGSMIKDGTKSPKEKSTRSGRNSSANHASKRRSTMNSREAGYDEADALRRAIEASKEDASVDLEDGPRAPKRPRSDSEE